MHIIFVHTNQKAIGDRAKYPHANDLEIPLAWRNSNVGKKTFTEMLIGVLFTGNKNNLNLHEYKSRYTSCVYVHKRNSKLLVKVIKVI